MSQTYSLTVKIANASLPGAPPQSGVLVRIGSIQGTTDAQGLVTLNGLSAGSYQPTAYYENAWEITGSINIPFDGVFNWFVTEQAGYVPPATFYESYKGISIFLDSATGYYLFDYLGVPYGGFTSVKDAESKLNELTAPAPTTPTNVSAPSGGGWLSPLYDIFSSIFKWFGDTFITPIANVFSSIDKSVEGTLDAAHEQNRLIGKQIEQQSGSTGLLIGALFDGLKGLEAGLTKPLTDFGPAVAKEVSDAMSAHSPDPDIKAAVDEMVKMIISKQEEINKSISHSPIDPTQAQAAALTLAGELLAVSVSVPLAGILIDLLHPIKNVGAFDLAVNLMDNVGLDRVIPDIMSAPVEMGILPALHRYYNSIYQTELPNASELISLRSRNWLTEDAYKTGMTYQGLSNDWSATLLNGSYADPGIGLLRILYDMGSVSAADLPAYVNHLGYRPEYQDLITNYITKYQENRFRLRYVVAVGMGYSRGVVDAAELTTLITGAGYSQGSAEWIMKASDIRKEIIDRGSSKPRLVSVGELKLLYANDKITEDALRTELVLRKYTTDQVEILIEALNLSKSTEIEGHKKITLSISELLKAWEKEVITEDYLRIHLTLKGLTTEEQDILINTNKPSLSKAEIMKAYKQGIMSETDARSKLAANGLTTETIDILINTNKPTTYK